jgi:hypothetical protein
MHPEPFRLSTTVSFTMSPELYAQLRPPITIDNVFNKPPKRGTNVRNGLIAFLANPPPCPDLAPLLKVAPMPKRVRLCSLAIPDADLRKQLNHYANTHGVTVSAVLRRAAYEYTKPAEPNPTATIDAWGDAPKS